MPNRGERRTGGVQEAAEPGRADERLPGLHVRVLQLLVSPGELFDRLRERPVWIGALLLSIGLALASTLIVPEEAFHQAALAEMPEDAEPEAVQSALRLMIVVAYAASVLGPIVLALVVAGTMALIFNIGLGGEADFRQLFSASTHGLLILTLGGVVTLPLVLATGDLRTALTLHLLVPGLEEDGYLFRLLRGLNLFALWTCAVLGVAVERLYPRRTAGPAAATLIVLYVVLKAIIATFGGG